MIKSSFIVVARATRVWPALRTVRNASHRFKDELSRDDNSGMQETSRRAWDALTNVFEVLRNEQDHGNLAQCYMVEPTGFIVSDVTAADQQAMIAGKKIDRSHHSFSSMGLRDALNKIAHHNTALSTFRVDRRGAHYIILGGSHRNKRWVAEILISKLCKNAAAAARAISRFGTDF
jgi:hypothetical protein